MRRYNKEYINFIYIYKARLIFRIFIKIYSDILRYKKLIEDIIQINKILLHKLNTRKIFSELI